MKQLERGTLYQVYFDRRWVIAEYVTHVAAHTVHGRRGSDGATEWHEAASHCWKPAANGFNFRTWDKGLQVRPVTPETLAEIARLKGELERLQLERVAVQKELRSLCE